MTPLCPEPEVDRVRQRLDSNNVHNITMITSKHQQVALVEQVTARDVPTLSLQGSGVLYSMSSPHHTELFGTKC